MSFDGLNEEKPDVGNVPNPTMVQYMTINRGV